MVGEQKKGSWMGHDEIGRALYPERDGGLSFKDFHLFNIALLGRQVWQLINHKDTLCYRVFSFKYFHEGDPFRSKRVDKPSFL